MRLGGGNPQRFVLIYSILSHYDIAPSSSTMPRDSLMVCYSLCAQLSVGSFAVTRLGRSLQMQLEPELGSGGTLLAIGSGCTILLMLVTVCLHAAYKKVYQAMEDDPEDYPRYPSCLLGAIVIVATATIGLELAARIPAWASGTGSKLVIFEAFALGTFVTALAVHLMNVQGLVIVMRRAWHCSGAAALICYSLLTLVGLFILAVGLNVLKFCRPDLMERILELWK